MKSQKVKDLMVPLEEYATVSDEADLKDAVLALDKAQKEFDQNRYRHRAILVLDKNNDIVGKVSQHDLLTALEIDYKKLEAEKKGALSRFGLSDMSVDETLREHSFWNKPLDNLSKQAVNRNVKAFMHTPSKGEFIDENETMNVAAHRLIISGSQSLLVTRNEKIVGILRLTDVFQKVVDAIKEC